VVDKKLHLEATAEMPIIKRSYAISVAPKISSGSADIIPICQ
jgi:hypothetical protein